MSLLDKVKSAAQAGIQVAGSVTTGLLEYYPPVAFNFRVDFLSDKMLNPLGYNFQEVSGIEAKMEPKEVNEGGENRFEHRLPGRTTYDNLSLKRGMQTVGLQTPILDWCKETVSSDFSKKIETVDLTVSLMGPPPGAALSPISLPNIPIAVWFFKGAYPVKWSIGELDAEKDDVLIEEIELCYQYFERQV